MEPSEMNPLAPHHLPSFVTAPGGSDWLMTVMAVFLLVAVVSVGLVYLKLHALPEQMAHRTNKVQLQFVAVLALLALFTHNNLLWIAALLLALVELPNFSTPMNSIALSLEKLSGRDKAAGPPSEWNDLLSDDPPERTPPPQSDAPSPAAHPASPPPSPQTASPPPSPQTGREA
jgi:hypothetical protein